MIFIGIDTGKNGGIAVIADGHTWVARFDKETYRRVLSQVRREETLCYIEKVGAMPKQGVTSMFHFGENYGWIQGVLEANSITYRPITPQAWKKAMGVTADKATSIAMCKKLFPTVNLIPPRCRTEHDGCAEALLIAEYARRNYNERKKR